MTSKKNRIVENDSIPKFMVITKVSETEIMKTPHNLDVRKLYDHSSAQVMHITLQAGEALKPHITPVDAVFYILEGTADIMLGDEIKSVGANCLVESPKNIQHCIYNNSDKQTRILVIKAPKQTTSTIMV